MSPSIALSEPVRLLAAAARASLEGAGEPPALDIDIVHSAIDRHRIGPLLHRGAEVGRLKLAHETRTTLARHFLSNVGHCERISRATRALADALREDGIPFVLLKGEPLARLLYPAVDWRHCGDLDILVPPEMMPRSIAALRTAGFSSADAMLSLPQAVQKASFRLIRDVGLTFAKTGSRVELHSRPMFSNTISRLLLEADASLRPRRACQSEPVPEPALGPGLALYLLHHGAISGWSRLKWLVDIFLILGALGPSERRAVADLAERARTVAAVKASLILARQAFGEFDLDPLQHWISETAGRRAALKRAAAYATWLNEASNAAPNPLHDRRAALKSALLISDSAAEWTSTLARGAFSSSIRAGAKLLHGHAERSP